MLQRRSPVALIKSRFSPGHSTRPHKPLGRLLRILESTVGCLGAFWGSLEALWALTSVSEEGWAGRRPISEGEVATRSASLERRRFGAEGICTIAQSERPGPRSHPKSPQVTEQRARACRYARAAMPRGVCVCVCVCGGGDALGKPRARTGCKSLLQPQPRSTKSQKIERLGE